MKIKPLNILFNFFAILAAIAVIFVLFNIFSGAKGYAVVTDSMSPAINRGDVVFVKKTDFNSLSQGDIITVAFHDGGGYFTHRITEIDYEAGAVKTKGDANETEDPMPAEDSQVQGKVWYSVPLLEYLSIMFNELNFVKISVILAIIMIAVIALSSVLKTAKKVRGDKNEQN